MNAVPLVRRHKSRAPWHDISDRLPQFDERGSPEEAQELFFPKPPEKERPG